MVYNKQIGEVMRLGDDVLIEIVDIVRQGLVEGKDVSELLRALDVVGHVSGNVGLVYDQVVLSDQYKNDKGRKV